MCSVGRGRLSWVEFGDVLTRAGLVPLSEQAAMALAGLLSDPAFVAEQTARADLDVQPLERAVDVVGQPVELGQGAGGELVGRGVAYDGDLVTFLD